LWAKGLNEKDIHKEMFPVYREKCLSRKAVHSWVAKVSLMMMMRLNGGAKVAETTVKRLQGTGKAMGQVYQC
jgi:hypothetical protein